MLSFQCFTKIQNKIPLFYPTLFLILGIIYQQNIPNNFYILLISIFTTLLASFKTKKNSVVYGLIFFSGALLLENQKIKNINLLNEIKDKQINIIATIKNKKNYKKQHIKEELYLQVTKIYNDTFIKNKKFNLIFYTFTQTNLIPGQKIEIKNIKIKSQIREKKGNPFINYLLKEDILSTIFIKKLNYNILSKKNNPIKQYLYKKRKFITHKFKQKLNPTTFNSFASIFLGNKTETITTQDRNIFNSWGLSHYLARSGLHIVIFILIWQLILSLIPINIKSKNLILLSISIVYSALSWSSISFLRAFFVFLIFQISNLLEKQANFLHILILICLIILIKNPIQLFFLDFQLTFLLTFVLAITNKKFS